MKLLKTMKYKIMTKYLLRKHKCLSDYSKTIIKERHSFLFGLEYNQGEYMGCIEDKKELEELGLILIFQDKSKLPNIYFEKYINEGYTNFYGDFPVSLIVLLEDITPFTEDIDVIDLCYEIEAVMSCLDSLPEVIERYIFEKKLFQEFFELLEELGLKEGLLEIFNRQTIMED